MTTSIPVIPYAVRFCGSRISASHLAIIIHKWQNGLLDLQYWKHIASWCIWRLVTVLLKVESLAHSEILGALDPDVFCCCYCCFSIYYVSVHCSIQLSLSVPVLGAKKSLMLSLPCTTMGYCDIVILEYFLLLLFDKLYGDADFYLQ